MTTTSTSSRRSFIRTAGATLSAPLAVATVNASPVPPEPGEGDGLEARLAHLEDVNAIRALNQTYSKHLNAGAREEVTALFVDASDARVDPQIRGVAPDGFGEQDVVQVAADRSTATGLVYCTVHVESPIDPESPLVDMARQQGGGVVKRTERGVFENVYSKRDGVWKFQRSTYRPE